jgi:hypothetical protein
MGIELVEVRMMIVTEKGFFLYSSMMGVNRFVMHRPIKQQGF